MPGQDLSTLRCPCGLRLAVPAEGAPASHHEAACECGRRLDLQRAERSWTPVGEIFAEGSVPVEGFSRGLRLEGDAQRFWFPLVGRGGRRVIVHLVFSHRRRSAEVKHSDVKALTISGVDTPTEARRRWLAWWESAPFSRGSRARPVPGGSSGPRGRQRSAP